MIPIPAVSCEIHGMWIQPAGGATTCPWCQLQAEAKQAIPETVIIQLLHVLREHRDACVGPNADIEARPIDERLYGQVSEIVHDATLDHPPPAPPTPPHSRHHIGARATSDAESIAYPPPPSQLPSAANEADIAQRFRDHPDVPAAVKAEWNLDLSNDDEPPDHSPELEGDDDSF